MIRPSGSSKKLAGIPWIAYSSTTSDCHHFNSDTCGQSCSPSSLMAFIQASFAPGRSSDTPKTVKFLSLNAWYAATTFGFSCLQGPHQLAQKSTNTYLPRSDDSAIGVPAVSGWLKSGATAPMSTRFEVSNCAAIAFPLSESFSAADSLLNAGSTTSCVGSEPT